MEANLGASPLPILIGDTSRLYPSRGTQGVELTEDYFLGIGKLILVGIFIGIVAAIIRCVLFIYQCRAPKAIHKTKMFKKEEKYFCIRAALLIACLLGFILTCVQMAGSVSFTSGTNQIAYSTNDAAEAIGNTAINISTQLQSLELNIDTQPITDGVSQGLNIIKIIIENVFTLDNIRFTLLDFPILFGFATVILGFIAVFNKRPLIVSSIATFAVLTIFFIGVNFAFYLPASVLTDDTCQAIQNLKNSADSSDNIALQLIVQCENYGSYFEDSFGFVFEGIQNTLVELNNVTVSTLGLKLDTNVPSSGTFEENLQGTVQIITTDVQLINSRLQNATQQQSEIIKPFLTKATTFLSILNSIMGIVTCSFVQNVILSLESGLCLSLRSGTGIVVMSEILSVPVLVLILILSLVFLKYLGKAARSAKSVGTRIAIVQMCMGIVGILMVFVKQHNIFTPHHTGFLVMAIGHVIVGLASLIVLRIFLKIPILIAAIMELLFSMASIAFCIALGYLTGSTFLPIQIQVFNDQVNDFFKVVFLFALAIPATVTCLALFSLWRSHDAIMSQKKHQIQDDDDLKALLNETHDQL